MVVEHPTRIIDGQVTLPTSKSISNRLLIIQSLCKHQFDIHGLSDAEDTSVLSNLLRHESQTYNAGLAGTTARFLLARLCLLPGTQILTGEPGLKQRPIAPLVDALKSMGASVRYLESPGKLPVEIGDPPDIFAKRVVIDSSLSSQFISALLLIAPSLPDGLRITLQGKPSSRPYIEMTLRIMRQFGIQSFWSKNTISVGPGEYIPPQGVFVEPDWSAAAFFYEITALAEKSEIEFPGLSALSVQGDNKAIDLFQPLGVSTKLTDSGIIIKKILGGTSNQITVDFADCPDLAQPVLTTAAALGIPGFFKGLHTLRVKETDRIEALRQEFQKFGIKLESFTAANNPGMKRKGESGLRPSATARLFGHPQLLELTEFATWGDHRMAMCLAPLGLMKPIRINAPEVVTKSFPGYWKELQRLGFTCK